MAKNNRNFGNDQNGRNQNATVQKIYGEILKNEKKQNIHKLRLRAYCTHSTSPTKAQVYPKTLKNGERRWVCKFCDREMKLNKIEDAELQAAIETVCEACDFIKIMGNARDSKILDLVSDIELKTSGWLLSAYQSARNAGAKRQNRGNRGSRPGSRTIYKE